SRHVALLTVISGAGRTRARAGLGRVAVAHDGPADRALRGEGVAGTVGAAAGAVFRDVAGAVLRAAHGGGGLEGVRRARRTRPRAVLRRVARPRRRATDRARRLEGVGRARCTRPGAVLRRVAHAGRRAAFDARRLEGVGRAGGARARAALVHVAHPGRRAAYRPGVPRRVLAGVVRPVALIERARVAVGGARRARRLLGVRRAAGARPGAVLRRVALARRGAALRARGLEAVGGADGARARARLGHIAHPGRCAALRPRVARGMLADRARPVALVRGAWIGVGGARRPRRLLRVGRAVRPVPGAVLGEVALARRHAADGARGLEAIGGTGGARAAAGLRHVARPGRRAADRPRVPRRVLAGDVRPVALVERARVAVGGAGR